MINNKNRIVTIYKNITELANKGKSSEIEYKILIDKLSKSGDFDNLKQALYIYFHVDPNIEDFNDIRNKTWKTVMFNFENTFDKRIKKIMSNRKVYQIGVNIYFDDNTLLGQIYEEEIITDEKKYFVKNKEFGRFTGTRRTILKVVKSGVETILDSVDLRMSKDNELLNKYDQAFRILLE